MPDTQLEGHLSLLSLHCRWKGDVDPLAVLHCTLHSNWPRLNFLGLQWFKAAGFEDVHFKPIGPEWFQGERSHGLVIGCSVTGKKRQVCAGGYWQTVNYRIIISSRSTGQMKHQLLPTSLTWPLVFWIKTEKNLLIANLMISRNAACMLDLSNWQWQRCQVELWSSC